MAGGAWLAWIAAFAVSAGSCGGGGGGGGGIPGLQGFQPSWVYASWSGGALGPPNDLTDIEATEWRGLICPGNHLDFDYDGSTLNFVNRCNITVTYAICVTKGTLEGANVCAPDPLDTPTSQLLFTALNPGTLGDYINASGTLGVNFFWCSDRDQLVGGPVRCLSGP